MKVVAFFFYNNQNHFTSPVHISKNLNLNYNDSDWQSLVSFRLKQIYLLKKKIIIILLKKFNSSWFDWSVDAKAMLVCFSNFYVASPFLHTTRVIKNKLESQAYTIYEKKEAIIY